MNKICSKTYNTKNVNFKESIMYQEYIKEQKILERTEEEKKVELIKSIMLAKKELQNANNNFEHAELDMVDFYTYQIKASQEKLDYLIRVAKARGIVLDRINEIRIRIEKENEAV